MAKVKISGFTFIYNGIEGGYPFVQAIDAVSPYVDEMVVVDMQSTDETRHVLDQLDVRVIDGEWVPGNSEKCLTTAHAQHSECEHDIIWHFEADEVFDERLARAVHRMIQEGHSNLCVHRLQVEQNFQRCRWYPELVHRVFPKGSVVKIGHTTHIQMQGVALDVVSGEDGFLWDCTNCFRDDWMQRVRNNAELWGEQPAYRYTPYHFTLAPATLQLDQIENMLSVEHLTWEYSPFDLPDLLRELLGVTSYREWLKCQLLIA